MPMEPVTSLASPPQSPRASTDHRWTRWIVGLSALTAVGALGAAWQTNNRVKALEQVLVKRQDDSQNQVTEARLHAKQAEELSREASAKVALFDARLNEVAAQKTHVDELLRSLSQSRDENLLVDLESGLEMASQQSVLTGSSEPLIAALQTADERLARTAQTRFQPIRQAITRDLDILRTSASQDVLLQAQRLDESVALVNDLVLINAAPLSTAEMTAAASAASASTAKAPAPHHNTRQSAPVAASSASAVYPPVAENSWWVSVTQWWTPLWQELRGLVRVSHIAQADAVLMTPEQSYFVRENIKLKIMNARLSLLARQPILVQADLLEVQQALDRYFDPTHRKTIQLKNLLLQVISQSQRLSLPRPEQSLAQIQAEIANSNTAVTP